MSILGDTSIVTNDLENFFNQEIDLRLAPSIDYRPALLPLKEHAFQYLERMFNKIGSKTYSDSFLTSMQKKKVTLVSGCALFAVIAIALSQTTALTVAKISAFVSGIFLFGLADSFLKYDLQSKKSLETLRSKVQHWTFKKIKAHFAFEDLIGYDILKTRFEFYTQEEKVRIYAHIKDLYEESEQLEKKVISENESIASIQARMSGKIHSLNFRKQALLKAATHLVGTTFFATLSHESRHHLETLAEAVFLDRYQMAITQVNQWGFDQNKKLHAFKEETEHLMNQRYENLCESNFLTTNL